MKDNKELPLTEEYNRVLSKVQIAWLNFQNALNEYEKVTGSKNIFYPSIIVKKEENK